MINSDTSWEIAGDELYLQRNGIRYDPTADEVFSTIIEERVVFDDVPVGVPSNLKSLSFSKYPASLYIDIGYEPANHGSGLECEISAVGGDHRITLRNFRGRSCDHAVIGSTWYPFPRGLMQDLLALLEDAGIVDLGPVPFRAFMQLRTISRENELVRDHTAGSVIHPGIDTEPAEDALSLFRGTLYPYQYDGWRWLTFIVRERLGGILADEMGLGKTVQIIAVLAAPNRRKMTPSLIVGPGSLLENWRREFVKFGPSVSVCVHQGHARTGNPAVLARNEVVITSYDTVVRDSALFGMIDWKVVALDEAQAIKNPETRRAQSVKGLNRQVSIAITGTPVENRLRDLWSIADFVLPGYLGEQEHFERVFEDNPDGAQSIEPFVSPIMLRRKVADVAQDLPDRIVIPQVLTFSGQEASEYEALRQAIIQEYGSGASLVSLVKLRMFCTHPSLLISSDRLPRDPGTFTKFHRLCDILEEIFAVREKVLVFTSYNRMVDILIEFVTRQLGIYAMALDGRTPISHRQDVIDGFSDVEGPALLALNPRAAGTGLNITAANHVIHYNLEWNPATEDQASARAYRRGQVKPVTIHRLYIAGTVEEAIDQRVERKRQISDAAVVGVAGSDHEYDEIMRALQMTPAGAAYD